MLALCNFSAMLSLVNGWTNGRMSVIGGPWVGSEEKDGVWVP